VAVPATQSPPGGGNQQAVIPTKRPHSFTSVEEHNEKSPRKTVVIRPTLPPSHSDPALSTHLLNYTPPSNCSPLQPANSSPRGTTPFAMMATSTAQRSPITSTTLSSGIVAYTTSLHAIAQQFYNSGRLIQLLTTLGVTFTEVDLAQPESPHLTDISRMSGSYTLPQLFVGTSFVGTWDEVELLNELGKLTHRLKALETNRSASPIRVDYYPRSPSTRFPSSSSDYVQHFNEGCSKTTTTTTGLMMPHSSYRHQPTDAPLNATTATIPIASSSCSPKIQFKHMRHHGDDDNVYTHCSEETYGCETGDDRTPQKQKTASSGSPPQSPYSLRAQSKIDIPSPSLLESLREGYPILKYNLSNARCSYKYLWLAPDNSKLMWSSNIQNTNGISVVFLNTVTALTYNFLTNHSADSAMKHLRFSLVTSTRSVDFECEKREVFFHVYSAIHMLVYPTLPSLSVGYMLWKMAANLKTKFGKCSMGNLPLRVYKMQQQTSSCTTTASRSNNLLQ
jgi:glutaredoxin-related protein